MKRRFVLPLLFGALSIFSSSTITAQEERFQMGFLSGLNFATLEGEYILDYFGWNTGLQSTIKLSKRTQLAVELLYSQNGDYVLPDSYPNISYGKTRLNHLEIPLHFDFLGRTLKNEKVINWNLNAGIAYTRLLHHYVEDTNKIDVSEQIIYSNKSAFQMQLGGLVYLYKNLGLNLRASYPIRQALASWTLAVRLVYTLF